MVQIWAFEIALRIGLEFLFYMIYIFIQKKSDALF